MSERMVDSTAAAAAALDAALQQVDQEITAALADLRPPFSQLVAAQLRRSFPLHCAAFVLTVDGAADSHSPSATPSAAPSAADRKRIDLAAAIEVLRLALAVHTQLLDAVGSPGSTGGAGSPEPIDRSLLGSTVLAGDYCFSRAAALAARTGSPIVVDIFAQALQRVSEGTLRGLFRSGPPAGAAALPASQASAPAGAFTVERELCLAGVLAAGELAGLDAAERQADRQAALLLLDAWQGRSVRQWQPPADWPQGVAPARRERWPALLHWLAAAEI